MYISCLLSPLHIHSKMRFGGGNYSISLIMFFFKLVFVVAIYFIYFIVYKKFVFHYRSLNEALLLGHVYSHFKFPNVSSCVYIDTIPIILAIIKIVCGS